MSTSPTIAIAGASGFIGRHLIARIARSHDVVALSRSARSDLRPRVSWRRCDLFSLLQAEQALDGADVGVYLTHSMMPSARLTQARFEDMDLILADNFARAARKAGLKQIVYLGGILPEDTSLSPHLRSRLEVERALAAYGVPVTTLRAGLVVGAGGTSFGLLRRLVERAPVLLCPPWAESRTQPIAVDDVVTLLAACLGAEWSLGETYDIAGPDTVRYRDLLAETAAVLGRPARFASLPFSPPRRLLARGVAVLSGTPRELVGPLIESLQHDMLPGPLRLQARLGIEGISLRESIRRAVSTSAPPAGERTAQPAGPRRLRNTVRSVQRLPLPSGHDADWVGAEYMRWLPRGAFWPLLHVEVEGDQCRFYTRLFPLPLLELTRAPSRSSAERVLLYVTGGVLAAPENRRGRLEFRCILGGEAIITAIHDFVPRLPWFVYTVTQALAHLYVMHRFGRHLARAGEKRTHTLAKVSSST